MTKKALYERFNNDIDLGIRTNFEYDYDAILYSHAFRRLRHKTQVFFFPRSDHICTRLDHSLYVSSLSALACRRLYKIKKIQCDPLLASAIGIGHDLGHPPFGHAGERTLAKLAESIGGFRHEKFGLRIVDKIDTPCVDSNVVGLNLTVAVRDGIVNHKGEGKIPRLVPNRVPEKAEVGKESNHPCTVEGCIVRLIDKVAYLTRDVEDAIEAGVISQNEIPGEWIGRLSLDNSKWISFFLNDLVTNSDSKEVGFSQETANLLNEFDQFCTNRIYRSELIGSYETRVTSLLEMLFERLVQSATEYSGDYTAYNNSPLKVAQYLGIYLQRRASLYFGEESPATNNNWAQRVVLDFLSTLTDRFVYDAFSETFMPKPLV